MIFYGRFKQASPTSICTAPLPPVPFQQPHPHHHHPHQQPLHPAHLVSPPGAHVHHHHPQQFNRYKILLLSKSLPFSISPWQPFTKLWTWKEWKCPAWIRIRGSWRGRKEFPCCRHRRREHSKSSDGSKNRLKRNLAVMMGFNSKPRQERAELQ